MKYNIYKLMGMTRYPGEHPHQILPASYDIVPLLKHIVVLGAGLSIVRAWIESEVVDEEEC